MTTFPSISPTARLYSPGDIPSALQQSLSGVTTGFRRGDRRIGQTLQLTFSHLIESDMDLIKAHFIDRKGTFDIFYLPAEIWGDYSGAPPVGLIGNTAWRYSSPIEITDVSYDRFTVEVELISYGILQGDVDSDAPDSTPTPSVQYIYDALTASATPARAYVINSGAS